MPSPLDGALRDARTGVVGTAMRWRPRVGHFVVLAVALVVLVLAAELGAMTATDRALADARALRAAHQYPKAVAEYRATADRPGPLYLLARGTANQASLEADAATLEWAQELAATGQVDRALDASAHVTAPDLVPEARIVHAQIALSAVRAAASAGRFDEALRRLDQLDAPGTPAGLAGEGFQLRPGIEVDAAGALLDGGHDATAAVTFLDDALHRSPSGSIASRAQTLLPGALLAAGEQRAAAGDAQKARTLLARCVNSYRQTPAGHTAAALMAAPQPVSGALVQRDGTPDGGVPVRLAGGFRRFGVSGFTVSGPFFVARTDSAGGFRVEHVPLGVPLVFEFLDQQGWELIVDETRTPAYRVAAQPLAPTDLGFIREP
jgi:hypothetical protein